MHNLKEVSMNFKDCNSLLFEKSSNWNVNITDKNQKIAIVFIQFLFENKN